MDRLQGPPIAAGAAAGCHLKRIDRIGPPDRARLDPFPEHCFFCRGQRFLGWHLVRLDPFPNQTFIWLTCDDRLPTLAAAHRRGTLGEVEVSFGICTGMTVETAPCQDGRDFLIESATLRLRSVGRRTRSAQRRQHKSQGESGRGLHEAVPKSWLIDCRSILGVANGLILVEFFLQGKPGMSAETDAH